MPKKQIFRHKCSIKALNALLGISLLMSMACRETTKGSETSPQSEELIVGHWKLEDVDRGVSYSVTFHPNHNMTQYFSDSEGGGKERSGAWELRGDTLIIDEQQGSYKLRIETLNDSTLIVDKGEEDIPLYFRRGDRQ